MVPGDVYLCPAPLYHAAPLAWSMGTHRQGSTVVVMESFDAQQALSLIERHGVTHSQWVATMFVRMLKLDESVRRAHDLSTLRRGPCRRSLPGRGQTRDDRLVGPDPVRVLLQHRGRRRHLHHQ